MQIIKFRSEYRTKLFNKMMKVVFDLNIEDNALKIKVSTSHLIQKLKFCLIIDNSLCY
jgi:hypothetical protein